MNRIVVVSTLVAFAALVVRPAEPLAQPTAAPQDARPVEVLRPTRADVLRPIPLVGTVRAMYSAAIVPRVSGYVEQLGVEEGQILDRGDNIARIAVPELAAELEAARADRLQAVAMVDDAKAAVETSRQAVLVAQAEVASSEAEVEVCRAEIEMLRTITARHRTLIEKGAITQEDLEESEGKLLMSAARGKKAEVAVMAANAKVGAAQARFNAAEAAVRKADAGIVTAEAKVKRLETLIRFSVLDCPYDRGLIARRHLDPGALARKGETPLVTVMDVSKVRVRVDIPERELANVAAGTPATVVLDFDPDNTIESRLTFFSGALDPRTRTLPAEIVLDNDQNRFLPGMWCRVRLLPLGTPDALTLPAASIRTEKRKSYVWVLDAAGKAQRVDLELGFDDGQRVEIRDGLTGSEDVIVGNVTGLKIGDPVRKSER